MQSILIIDDEQKLRELLARILKLEGYRILEAESIKAAEALLQREDVQIVLSDVRLPDGNGVDFSRVLKDKYPHIEVIVLTAFGTISDGVKAIQNGAYDYIVKGDDNERIIPLISKAFEKIKFQDRIRELESKVSRKYSFDKITGESAAIKQAITLAQRVAQTDATVLLNGETGTGKEVFAQSIHQASRRSNKSFVAINCSAFSREILESELFGHTAGAFTGAVKNKKGLLEEADGGTLFLDEIGEMSADLQAKLLRVLESGEYIRVGETKVSKVNLRLIAATNRDLQEEIKSGNFREDLYYRISVFRIVLPSLRERSDDIPLIAESYLEEFNIKSNQKVKALSEGLRNKLKQIPWKGNVRELKNVMERMVILAEGELLTEADLPFEYQLETGNNLSSLSLDGIEKAHIQKVLQLVKGNKAEAAKILNIGLTTLYRKIEEYQLT
ncbi:sigma-54-dependent transcriptional regulator [Desertivirga arenae]|uniref:sigma-54-dependent transcriptional regulator n=1 Tax=Desertivirga arenae TaxID=2810309 RepID=UPI001A95A380|nr:sigma-54 dependent transcriptional regulator [Pedobacter sp. SYSU D00823]